MNKGDIILATIDGAIERVKIYELSPTGQYLFVGLPHSRGWRAWIRLLDVLETLKEAQ